MGDMVKLSNGKTAPALAFGTAFIPKEKLGEVLAQALDTGYRHIDTAYGYDNEQDIGEVLHQYFALGKLKRDEVFVTTKLWVTCMGKDDVRGAVEESLRRLKLTYVDLLLIHHPWGFKNRGDGTLMPVDEHGNYELEHYDITETWKALEHLVTEGKICSLGVSNFNSEQTERICSVATVRPVINQVECHAFLPQRELQEFCGKRNILLEAYAPLGSPGRPEHLKPQGEEEPVLLDEPLLQTIGDKYGKTPAQVLLRNLLQRGFLVSVKTAAPSRAIENFQVFDFLLSEEDMQAIDKLSKTSHRYYAFKHIPRIVATPGKSGGDYTPQPSQSTQQDQSPATRKREINYPL